MNTASLTAISPIDGRYYEKLKNLNQTFSEFALIRLRVKIEVNWLIMLTNTNELTECPPLTQKSINFLNELVKNFSTSDANRVKEIEKTTQHDIKAVEYFIKERIKDISELQNIQEYIHFGCTSEDINNLAHGLSLLTAKKQFLLPKINEIITDLKNFSHKYANQPMLSRTHGQVATPTTLGKEIANFIHRIIPQVNQLEKITIPGKLNGASGNYNALAYSCPEIDWQNLSKNFVTSFGLSWNEYTTQIEPHDGMAEFFAILVRINTILIDFCRDMWSYISIDYFQQKNHAGETGSSVMPHKINPINFENAEGNLGIANTLLNHMIIKLPISRWQRDLTDSTVQRNIGVAIAHSTLAFQMILAGLKRIEPNLTVISNDLDQHWEILAEPIQTIMRRYNLETPYEKLKKITRGKKTTKQELHELIKSLPIKADIKQKLLQLTPASYIGYAEELANSI